MIPARTYTERCLICEHPVSATSPEGLRAAMQAHVDHLNDTADRDTDPHYESGRLTALMLH